MKRTYTILDIAQQAGVSHGTVSRVLNNRNIRCRPETRKRILRIAQELNYQPNASAQSLKTQTYHTIGFLAYDITDMFVVDCIGAIEETLVNTAYRALWLSARLHASEKQSDLLKKLRSLPIDGLIVLESDQLISDVELLTLHARDQMRVSTLIRKLQGGHLSSVTLDNALGIQLLVEHLVGLGHREIGFLHDAKARAGATVRFETFKKLLQEKKLPLREECWQPTGGTVEEGFRAAKKLLACASHPTAIIAFNDLAAFGCIRACKEQKIAVPERMSVAGFDDIRMSGHYNPSLTTIWSDYPALAKSAVNQMISMIEGRWELFKAEHVVVKPSLVARESTAPPPPGGPDSRPVQSRASGLADLLPISLASEAA